MQQKLHCWQCLRWMFPLSVCSGPDAELCGNGWNVCSALYRAQRFLLQWFPISLQLLHCSWPAAPSSSFSPPLDQLTDAADQLPQHTAKGGELLESCVSVCVCRLGYFTVGCACCENLNNIKSRGVAQTKCWACCVFCLNYLCIEISTAQRFFPMFCLYYNTPLRKLPNIYDGIQILKILWKTPQYDSLNLIHTFSENRLFTNFK